MRPDKPAVHTFVTIGLWLGNNPPITWPYEFGRDHLFRPEQGVDTYEHCGICRTDQNLESVPAASVSGTGPTDHRVRRSRYNGHRHDSRGRQRARSFRPVQPGAGRLQHPPAIGLRFRSGTRCKCKSLRICNAPSVPRALCGLQHGRRAASEHP